MQKLTKASQDRQRSIGYIDTVGWLTAPSSSYSLEKGRGEGGVDDHALTILADQPQFVSPAWFLVQVIHDAVVVVVCIGKCEVGLRPLNSIAASGQKLALPAWWQNTK